MGQQDEIKKDQLNDLIKSIYEGLVDSKLPSAIKDKIKLELEQLKEFTLNARPARIAIVGRRGAGKSSMINAIFSEQRAEIGDVKARTGIGKWHTYTSESGNLEILDTRGLGEADRPEEEISQATAMEEVQASIKEKCPDAILFLCKAKEVSSRIDEDLMQLSELKRTIESQHQFDIPIVGIVTQVDELSPKSVDQPPFNHEVKQKNIADAVEVLSTKLRESVFNPVQVIPVSSYMEFENGQIVYDTRWNIDLLLDFLIEQLPNQAQLKLAQLSQLKSVQKNLARRIGKSISGVTGAIGASPIPIADIPIITGLQMFLVTTIGLIGGKKLDKKGIAEFLSALGLNVAAGFAFRQVARQLLKVIPVAGNIISGAVATAGTYALSEAAIAYFIDEVSIESTKQQFNKVFKERKENDS
ncbi:sodium-dependent bicarbonate transport family permease [Mesobacillus foraminis]|uniref:GTPase family protein n=1 Tax=Mesobacillus foraminis TaxID=279826 RepID=UPI001BECBF5C|nr:GTPase [Mesobacillus foraminis]MBT2759288.1 sodium-dependent bicarbonate transport family permease [Mesobacillus foraminis]